ncbi:YjbH domain-containing protein [Planktomarina temperata]|nr:YjbH domain-containing protein [Planktomarina temperata]
MKLFWAALSGVLCTAHISFAEPRVTYNAYGMPGLVDMPSAQSAPDAELSFSVSQSGKSLRNTLTFQITPPADGGLSLLIYRKANTNTLRPIF